MNGNDLPSMTRYRNQLKLSSEWLLKSIEKGKGGSCAYFSPVLGWSKPYPETTGYIIPTLLRLADYFQDSRYKSAAIKTGHWLLSIQEQNGAWRGGLHPNTSAKDSVFNTGQILKGMVALHDHTNERSFLDAANRGAEWLALGVDAQGLWPAGDYKSSETPSYYSHVAWPLLEVWARTGIQGYEEKATRFLDRVLSRRLPNGVISQWGFDDQGPAFTHTIAYTIRGFQESARILDNYPKYAEPIDEIIEFFVKKSELSNGRVPGSFDAKLRGNSRFVCLTGNAQLAISILLMEERNPDLRLVNAAAKMIDFIESVSNFGRLSKSTKGAVAGSYPLWGPYMFLRYPNWAAKYYCDSLMLILRRLEKEV